MPQKATASSWKIKPMPAAHKELPLSGTYSVEEYEKMSYGFLPKGQDDKWFIYMADHWLHFHRSWTGTCVFKMQLVPEADYYQAVKVIANRDPEQYRSTSDQQDVQLLSFLVDKLLLGQFTTLPMPKKMSAADQQRHQQHVMGKEGDGMIRLDLKKNGG